MTDTCNQTSQSTYKILVAMANDDTADWALLEGIGMAARRPDAELHVVHAVKEALSLDSGRAMATVDARLSRAPKIIERRLEHLWGDNPPLTVVAHIQTGAPTVVILQAATDIGADIIVVGTHRRSGLTKLRLGSVAEQVLRDASCPVLVALPRDYTGSQRSASIVPPCGACVEVRRSTESPAYWCEDHSREYLQTHIYEPRRQSESLSWLTYSEG